MAKSIIIDKNISSDIYFSQVGNLLIQSKDHKIIKIKFIDNHVNIILSPNQEIENCKKQLNEYFEGNRKKFDFDYNLEGTDFQLKVWDKLLTIPFGKTINYLSLAESLGSKLVIRAAANANSKNPLAIVVPCHRVIGKNGELTGYAGGLERKKWLLEFEKEQNSKEKQLNLFK